MRQRAGNKLDRVTLPLSVLEQPSRRNAASCCPCCGQRLLIRCGVALPPLLADLFDMIWRSAECGVAPEVLAGVFYPGKSLPAARRAIAVNIFHLNTKLAETDVELRSGQGRQEPYRLQRRRRNAKKFSPKKIVNASESESPR